MTRTATAALALALTAGFAHAEPIDGTYFDLPGCDNHGTRQVVEEFGDASVFAPDETFDHVSTLGINFSACPPMDDPSIPNALVVVTNLTGRFLSDLYYVADEGTTFSNVDGAGFGAGSPTIRTPAFRIDSFGLNRPLLAESMTPDGIFEPGETWEFIVQDYGNALGLPADAFFSIGMSGDSPFTGAGVVESSASIVRTVIPAPASSLLGLTGLALMRRRR